MKVTKTEQKKPPQMDGLLIIATNITCHHEDPMKSGNGHICQISESALVCFLRF